MTEYDFVGYNSITQFLSLPSYSFRTPTAECVWVFLRKRCSWFVRPCCMIIVVNPCANISGLDPLCRVINVIAKVRALRLPHRHAHKIEPGAQNIAPVPNPACPEVLLPRSNISTKLPQFGPIIPPTPSRAYACNEFLDFEIFGSTAKAMALQASLPIIPLTRRRMPKCSFRRTVKRCIF